MNISNTRIQHKRYILDEWENGILIELDKPKLIPKLSLGELGLLLSDDRSQVKEVRIGIDPEGDQNFKDGLLIGTKDQFVKLYRTQPEFPNIGSEDTLYVAQDTNIIWRWDDKDLKYYECSSLKQEIGNDWKEIKVIDGGDAKNNPSFIN